MGLTIYLVSGTRKSTVFFEATTNGRIGTAARRSCPATFAFLLQGLQVAHYDVNQESDLVPSCQAVKFILALKNLGMGHPHNVRK